MSDEYTPEAWRMTGYYPDTYAKFMSALGVGIDYKDDDYARYEAQFLADLAAHDAAVKADAMASILPTEMVEHWEWTQRRRARFDDRDCVCAICQLMARVEPLLATSTTPTRKATR